MPCCGWNTFRRANSENEQQAIKKTSQGRIHDRGPRRPPTHDGVAGPWNPPFGNPILAQTRDRDEDRTDLAEHSRRSAYDIAIRFSYVGAPGNTSIGINGFVPPSRATVPAQATNDPGGTYQEIGGVPYVYAIGQTEIRPGSTSLSSTRWTRPVTIPFSPSPGFGSGQARFRR